MMEKNELKRCPFCGGEAGVLIFDDVPENDVNFGGSCISCRQCAACSPVHFDRKENLYSSWNDRMSEPQKLIEAEVISAACRLIDAHTYVHPTLTRENAVNAATAELYGAVGKWHGSQPAKAAVTTGKST